VSSGPRITCQRLWECSFPFSLSLLVRPLIPLEALLTCISHCLESVVTPEAFSVSLGMPLEHFLYPGTELSLDCSHHLAIIEAGLCSIGIHRDGVFCVFCAILVRHLSMYQFFTKSPSPTSALYSRFSYSWQHVPGWRIRLVMPPRQLTNRLNVWQVIPLFVSHPHPGNLLYIRKTNERF